MTKGNDKGTNDKGTGLNDKGNDKGTGLLLWVFDKLMRNPGPEELPELLPSAWLEAQREPAIEAVA